MLNAIRKRSGGIVTKVLLVLLVLSFGVWGVGDYIGGSIGGTAVATVGDRDISPQRYANEVRREVERLRRILGDSIDLETARQFGIQDQVLGRMVRSILFSLAAEDVGMITTDDQVRAAIQTMPSFQGITGGFDREAFRQGISNAGYTEASFIALIRDEMRRSQLVDSLQAGAKGSSTVAKLIYAYREETRDADMAIIPYTYFTVDQPTQDEVAAYHQDNERAYMAPEYRAVTYLQLDAADLTADIDVSEEDIIEAYDARAAEFMTQGRRNIEQAIFANEEAASSALAQINEGKTFDAVVTELTGASVASLSLGWVSADDLIGDLAKGVFATKTGSVSVPLQSPLGWHLINVIEAEKEAVKTLDSVRDTLKETVALEKAIGGLYALANDLEDKLGSGASLEEAAAEVGGKVATLNAIDASGLDATGTAIANIPLGDFVATAFSTEEGSESVLTESSDSAYFIVRVDSVVDPALRPLASVKDDVIAAIVAKRKHDEALIVAGDLVAKLNASSVLADVVSNAGAEVNRVNGFKRDGSGGVPAGIPKNLSIDLFAKNIGDGGLFSARDGIVIGHLKAITQVDSAANQEAVDALKAELDQNSRDTIIDQLAIAMESKFGVSVNQNTLNQAF